MTGLPRSVGTTAATTDAGAPGGLPPVPRAPALTPNERNEIQAEIDAEIEALWQLLERPALAGAEHRRKEAIELKLREIDRLEGLLA